MDLGVPSFWDAESEFEIRFRVTQLQMAQNSKRNGF